MGKEQAATRTAIVTAALELIAENGFHGAPTAKIAQRAGVGAGSIYRYFHSKDELITAVFYEVEARLHEMICALDSQSLPVRERFMRTHLAVFRYLLENMHEYKFMVQFYNSPYGVELRRKRLASGEDEPYRALFEYGISQQVIKALPLEMLCSLVFGPLEFVIRSHEAGLIILDSRMLESVVAATWDAIRR